MNLVKPSHTIISIYSNLETYNSPLTLIEIAGRTCYKSENKITKGSAKKFVQKLINLGHESVIEHSAMTVKFICDRGISHELVRHRLCAFSQESTRYCNYKGGITFVIPPWVNIPPGNYNYSEFQGLDNNTLLWLDLCHRAEKYYKELLSNGWSPQQARSVLPNSLKTEIVVTTNLREWRHIFRLRCSKAAHPQMRELMIPLLRECKETIPVIFDDINED